MHIKKYFEKYKIKRGLYLKISYFVQKLYSDLNPGWWNPSESLLKKKIVVIIIVLKLIIIVISKSG